MELSQAEDVQRATLTISAGSPIVCNMVQLYKLVS